LIIVEFWSDNSHTLPEAPGDKNKFADVTIL
jgi:hypothetical protein